MDLPVKEIVSQSLPNQVNDFNSWSAARQALAAQVSQSLPNQVNDFNDLIHYMYKSQQLVAIPSKPGQRLQFGAS